MIYYLSIPWALGDAGCHTEQQLPEEVWIHPNVTHVVAVGLSLQLLEQGVELAKESSAFNPRPDPPPSPAPQLPLPLLDEPCQDSRMALLLIQQLGPEDENA